MQRLNYVFKEMSSPHNEETGHRNQGFVVVGELLSNQGVLYRTEYVAAGWGNVGAAQRMRQNGPTKFHNFHEDSREYATSY